MKQLLEGKGDQKLLNFLDSTQKNEEIKVYLEVRLLENEDSWFECLENYSFVFL